MKKITAFVIALILIISTCTIFAFAKEDESKCEYRYYNQPVLDEVKSDTQLILNSANSMVLGKFSRQISEDDLDFDRAVRLYNDNSILEQEDLCFEDITSYINLSSYVYVLPVDIDESTVYLTISKGEPLTDREGVTFTEEEIAKIQSREGRWYVPELSVGTSYFNYKAAVEDVLERNNINSANIIYIGGFCSAMPITAVCFDDADNAWFIDIVELNIKSYQSGGDDSQKELYTFSEVKELANSSTLEDGQNGGAGGNAKSEAKDEWVKSGKRWWYRHSDGTYTTNDWEFINGSWYYFDAKGWMKTGWQKIGNYWYYMNSSGAMQTGWKQIGGKWYYLNSNGRMKTGWQKVGSYWYYMNTSGAMQTGWLRYSGRWYFLESSGRMRIANLNYNGKVYRFNTSGVCLNP